MASASLCYEPVRGRAQDLSFFTYRCLVLSKCLAPSKRERERKREREKVSDSGGINHRRGAGDIILISLVNFGRGRVRVPQTSSRVDVLAERKEKKKKGRRLDSPRVFLASPPRCRFDLIQSAASRLHVIAMTSKYPEETESFSPPPPPPPSVEIRASGCRAKL